MYVRIWIIIIAHLYQLAYHVTSPIDYLRPCISSSQQSLRPFLGSVVQGRWIDPWLCRYYWSGNLLDIYTWLEDLVRTVHSPYVRTLSVVRRLVCPHVADPIISTIVILVRGLEDCLLLLRLEASN